MRTIFCLVVCFTVTSCMTLSGNYVVVAHDDSGVNLEPKLQLTAHGSGIYTIRNALCAQHPGATVIITDAKTGEELKGESPYKCRK
jgi:hypothetical protein